MGIKEMGVGMKNWQKTGALVVFTAAVVLGGIRLWAKAGADIENPKILAELRDIERERLQTERAKKIHDLGYSCAYWSIGSEDSCLYWEKKPKD